MKAYTEFTYKAIDKALIQGSAKWKHGLLIEEISILSLRHHDRENAACRLITEQKSGGVSTGVDERLGSPSVCTLVLRALRSRTVH